MSRKTAQRWLAVLVAAAVLSFTFAVVAHWHDGLQEDQQCRLCHFAHAPAIDLSQGSALPAPISVRWVKAAAALDPQIELIFHQISSRAPPAAAELS